jgi:hypothetical protein
MGSGNHSGPTWTGRVLFRLGPLTVLFKRLVKRKVQEQQILDAEPKYPHIKVRAPSGNPEDVLRAVVGGLIVHDVSEDEIQAFMNEALSDDYGHMLVTVARWVDVVE